VCVCVDVRMCTCMCVCMSTRCDIVVCVSAGARECFICGIHLVTDDSEQDEAICIVFMLQHFL